MPEPYGWAQQEDDICGSEAWAKPRVVNALYDPRFLGNDVRKLEISRVFVCALAVVRNGSVPVEIIQRIRGDRILLCQAGSQVRLAASRTADDVHSLSHRGKCTWRGIGGRHRWRLVNFLRAIGGTAFAPIPLSLTARGSLVPPRPRGRGWSCPGDRRRGRC